MEKIMKQIVIKTLVLLLVLMMALLCVASCTTSEGSGSDGTTEAGTPSGSDSGTSGENTPPAGISVEELKSYKIVYPEGTSEEVFLAISKLQNALRGVCGKRLEMGDDFVKEGTSFKEKECEILIGAANRTQSIAFCRSLRTEDYGYCVADKKIVIAGATDETIVLAIEKFLADIEGVKGEGEDIFLSSEASYLYKGTYDVEEVLLNGANLYDYSIVYPRKDDAMKAAAKYLAAQLLEMYSYNLAVISDERAVDAHEIWVGDVSRDGATAPSSSLDVEEYLLSPNGGSIQLAGGTNPLVYRAIHALLAGLAEGKTGASASYTLPAEMKVTCDPTGLRAMSFNIRNGEFTAERIALVFRVIDTYQPDTIGFQEVTAGWREQLNKQLGDRYDYVGEPRNANGTGESSPVYYRKDKFRLLEGGTKWLSETPDTPGSKVEESQYPRVYSYAYLEIIATGQRFMCINTHFDHTNDTARQKQAEILVKFVKECEDQGLSYIVTGDFNAQTTAASYEVLAKSPMKNASQVAKKRDEGATFQNYGQTEKVIDYIFVTPKAYVSYYKACTEMLTDSNGNPQYPSDHNAIIADYIIP